MSKTLMSPTTHHHPPQADELGLALDEEDLELLRDAEKNPDALVTDTPNDQKLKTFSVICIIANRMIGSGIFSTPAKVVRGTNSIAVALIFWIVGAIVTACGLCVYLELGLSIPKYKLRGSGDRKISVPRSGGEKNYLEYIYRRPRFLATCVFAVVFITVGNTAGNAISFAQNFLQMINQEDAGDWAIRGVAIAIVTFACFLHGTWRAGGIYLNNILATLKVGVLLVIIGAGMAAYGGAFETKPGEKLVDAFEVEDKAFPKSDYGTYGYAESFLSVMFSYGGFMNANYVLSEVHKPQKTLKKGAFTAVGLVAALYILTNIAYFGAVTKAELVEEAGTTVATFFFRKVFGEHVAANRVLPGFIALSSLGNIIVVTFIASRVKAEIAKEGIIPFPHFFAANTPTLLSRLLSKSSRSGMGENDQSHHFMAEQTPAGALLLHWAFSIIIVLAPPVSIAYGFFVNLYSYTINSWMGALLAGGLIWLRYRPKSTWVKESSFKPWGGPTMAIIFLVFNLFLIVAPFIKPQKESFSTLTIKWFVFPTVGTGLFFAGGLYWFLLRFVWAKLIYKRELQQTRIPILLDGVQVHEIVIFSWVVPGSQEQSYFETQDGCEYENGSWGNESR